MTAEIDQDKLTECPKCGSDLSTIWQKARKLRKECRGEDGCGWRGEAYTPPQKPVNVVKTISTGGAWHYEGFDKYGHTFAYSRGFGTFEECKAEAEKDVERHSKDPDYGPCSAIIWPPTTTVRGTLVPAPGEKTT